MKPECSGSLLAFLVFLGPHDVDRSCVERSLDVRSVVFLDHLDTRAAVLSDLVDVGALHQPQTDVCMPHTVGRTGSSFAVKAKILFVEDGFEKFALPLRKNKVRRSSESVSGGAPAGLHTYTISATSSFTRSIRRTNVSTSPGIFSWTFGTRTAYSRQIHPLWSLALRKRGVFQYLNGVVV